jgi:hypothetical protein
LYMLFFSGGAALWSQITMTLNGAWSYTLLASDIPVAGADCNSSYTSTLTPLSIFLKRNGGPNSPFTISVKRQSDTLWDTGFRLDVFMTDSPNPPYVTRIDNPVVNINLTAAQNFVGGAINANKSTTINIRYTLYNMSVLKGVHNYSTTIIYYLTDV